MGWCRGTVSSSDDPPIQRLGGFNITLVWALWLTHVVCIFSVLLMLHVVLNQIYLIRILSLTQLGLFTIVMTFLAPSGTVECLYICTDGTNQFTWPLLGCSRPSSLLSSHSNFVGLCTVSSGLCPALSLFYQWGRLHHLSQHTH